MLIYLITLISYPILQIVMRSSSQIFKIGRAAPEYVAENEAVNQNQ
jgi:hypothetical protein